MLKHFLVVFICFSFLTIVRASDIPAGIEAKMSRLKDQEQKYWGKGDWENHMRVCHEFLSNYEEYLTDDEKGTWNVKIAGSFIELGSYFLAVEYLQKGIVYADENLITYAYGQLGLSCIGLEDYTKAIEYYEKAIATAKCNGEVVAHTNSLGYVYFLDKNFSKAEEYYKVALNKFKEGGVDSIQHLIIHSNLGSLYFQKGERDAGLELLEALEGLTTKEWQRWFEVEINIKLSRYYIQDAQCSKAKLTLGKLESMLDEDSISSDYLAFLELSMQYAQTCGDNNNIEEYAVEFLRVSKAFRDQEHDRLIVIEKLQRDELKKRLKLASRNNLLQKKAESQYQKMMVLYGVLTLIIIAALYVLWKSARNRQKRKERMLKLREILIVEKELSSRLQSEMEEKELRNKKLELMHVLHSANNSATLLEELHGRLAELRNKKGDVQDDISQLLGFLKSHSNLQAINEAIEKNIEVIGGDFRDRFFNQYADLTQSEEQLVLLIRIGLSTKEMAMMRNVEPSSIRIFKYRLKTKLNLGKEEDLSDFIQKY